MACVCAKTLLRFEPGDLEHALQYDEPFDRLKRVLRVEYEENVVT